MTIFKYGTRSLAELQKQEFVSAAERRQLDAAYDFLLRVRNELHFESARPTDVLNLDSQPKVAWQLGYTQADTPLRAIAAYAGTYGITFVLSVVGAYLADALHRRT